MVFHGGFGFFFFFAGGEGSYGFVSFGLLSGSWEYGVENFWYVRRGIVCFWRVLVSLRRILEVCFQFFFWDVSLRCWRCVGLSRRAGDVFLNLFFRGKLQLEVIVCVFLVWGAIIGGSFSGLRSSWWGVLVSSFSDVFPLGFINLCDTGVVNVVPMANLVYG